MVPYDNMFDFKIKLGHCDQYHMTVFENGLL